MGDRGRWSASGSSGWGREGNYSNFNRGSGSSTNGSGSGTSGSGSGSGSHGSYGGRYGGDGGRNGGFYPGGSGHSSSHGGGYGGGYSSGYDSSHGGGSGGNYDSGLRGACQGRHVSGGSGSSCRHGNPEGGGSSRASQAALRPPSPTYSPPGSPRDSPPGSPEPDTDPHATLRPILLQLASGWRQQPGKEIHCPFTLRGLSTLEMQLQKRYLPMAKALGLPQHPSDCRRCGEVKSPCCKPPCLTWEALQQHADKGAHNKRKRRDDDDDDDNELHSLLAKVMRSLQNIPAQRFGTKVDSQAFEMTIPWPPLLHLERLPTNNGDSLNSSAMLLQKFGRQGAEQAFPIFSPHFTNMAVLVFRDSRGGLERAKAFLENSRSDLERGVAGGFESRWVTQHEFDQWKVRGQGGKPVMWAKKLLRLDVRFEKKDVLEREMEQRAQIEKEEQARLVQRKMEEAQKEKELREQEAMISEQLKLELEKK